MAVTRPCSTPDSWDGKTVLVSDIAVADASQEQISSWIASRRQTDRPLLAYALHVGGLVEASRSAHHKKTMNSADLTYADGIAVVILGRRSGARRIKRSPTTDLAPQVLACWQGNGTPPRIALIGGEPGLAERAASRLEALQLGEVVYTSHGFRRSWDQALSELESLRPDILFVGMGSPIEMEWCESHLSQLPSCVVMTCGGWFGFLAGEEKRAPRWARKIGAEWVFRLLQHPQRLFIRYASGARLLFVELIRPRKDKAR